MTTSATSSTTESYLLLHLLFFILLELDTELTRQRAKFSGVDAAVTVCVVFLEEELYAVAPPPRAELPKRQVAQLATRVG